MKFCVPCILWDSGVEGCKKNMSKNRHWQPTVWFPKPWDASNVTAKLQHSSHKIYLSENIFGVNCLYPQLTTWTALTLLAKACKRLGVLNAAWHPLPFTFAIFLKGKLNFLRIWSVRQVVCREAGSQVDNDLPREQSESGHKHPIHSATCHLWPNTSTTLIEQNTSIQHLIGPPPPR